MALEFQNSVQNPRIRQYILVFCRYFTHPWVSPYGPAFSCSNLILSNLSGQRKADQITDTVLGICPFGASEKRFKFIPDEFVESNRI
jgi:hypothetical protein